MRFDTEEKRPSDIPWYLKRPPEERRKKYRILRTMGIDSYQADKMKDWPWPAIDKWIKQHSQLGNPNVKQQQHKPHSAAVKSEPRLQLLRDCEVSEGGSLRVAMNQESLY